MSDLQRNTDASSKTCRFVLFSTSACHLCEEALGILEDLHAQLFKLAEESGYSFKENRIFVIEELDVADDSALIERYGKKIPVLCSPSTCEELAWPFDIQAAYQFIYPHLI